MVVSLGVPVFRVFTVVKLKLKPFQTGGILLRRKFIPLEEFHSFKFSYFQRLTMYVLTALDEGKLPQDQNFPV